MVGLGRAGPESREGILEAHLHLIAMAGPPGDILEDKSSYLFKQQKKDKLYSQNQVLQDDIQ